LEASGQLIELEDAVDIFEFSAVLNQAVAERACLEILRPTPQTDAAPGIKSIEIGIKFDSVGLQQTTAKLGSNVAFSDKNSPTSIK
jgi:hypothetical protein